jgi:hypothetical protein
MTSSDDECAGNENNGIPRFEWTGGRACLERTQITANAYKQWGEEGIVHDGLAHIHGYRFVRIVYTEYAFSCGFKLCFSTNFTFVTNCGSLHLNVRY